MAVTLNILALTVHHFTSDATRKLNEGVSLLDMHFPRHWPTQLDVINWAAPLGPGEAAVLILFGIIFLLFGINIYKVLVMVNAALIGAFLGAQVGDQMGAMSPGAIVGGFTAAAIAWPMMRHAVAIMGAGCGLIVGVGLWRAFRLPPELHWAGGVIGAIAFGMLSLVLFKGCVMMYTSLQGAAMTMFGVLALALKYPHVGPQLKHMVELKPFMLPMAIFIPTLIGLIYQQSNPTGGGGGGGAKAPVKK